MYKLLEERWAKNIYYDSDFLLLEKEFENPPVDHVSYKPYIETTEARIEPVKIAGLKPAKTLHNLPYLCS